MLRLGWIAWVPVALAVAITAGVALAGGGMGGLTGGPGGCSLNCTLTGTTTFTGGANVAGDVLPDANATRNLGGSSLVWSGVYSRNLISDASIQITPPASGYVTINNGFAFGNTKTAGTQALTAGSATVTVFAGARCVCSDTTAAAAVKCSVASTTLTITGTTTDVIAYLCFA